MRDSEVKAKIVATVIATVFAWLGNRYWTFRHRKTTNMAREAVMFAVINGIGLAISAGCVGLAKYVLHIQSQFWLFFAGVVVGTALGTVFRWFAYRFWVFNEELDEDPEFAEDRQLFEPEAKTSDEAQTKDEAKVSPDSPLR